MVQTDVLTAVVVDPASNLGIDDGDDDDDDVPLTGFESLPSDCPYNMEYGLSCKEVTRRLEEHGYNQLPENVKNKWIQLLESFWGPMPAMIWIAIIVELATGIADAAGGGNGDAHFVDFAVLMVLQCLNSIVGWHEEMKAGDAVAALKSSLAPKANVKRDGDWTVVDCKDLVPGDTVVLALGGAVPADCTLLEGKPILVDQASLTGESLPVKMQCGNVAKMGSNVTAGEVEAIVTATGANTFFGKTAALLNSVDDQSSLDKLLLNILKAILAVGAPCILIIIVVLATRNIKAVDIVVLVVVLIVAIVPIANAVVCTSTLAFGSTALAADGAIVTRLAAIEELAGMNMLCSDKTGTLTLNKMVMQQVCIENGDTFDFPHETQDVPEAQDVLLYATLAAKWKETPKDALDTLTLNATRDRRAELDTYDQIDYEPFDPAIKRTAATLRDPKGRVFGCTKGAPNVVLSMVHNYHTIAGHVEELTENFAERGIRCIAVARTLEQQEDTSSLAPENVAEMKWRFVGLVTFLDPPRPDTKETIANAHNLGVKVKMITGDHAAIAKETCRVLGMGTTIQGTELLPDAPADAAARLDTLGPMCEEVDGFAGVYPEHKFMIVDILQKTGWTCGMTGDGVNDAPALKKAQVGIAVQGATDAARAAADIVLTHPGLSTIIKAIKLSRLIFQRIKSYLIYRVTSSFMLGMFFVLSISIVIPLDATGCEVLNTLPELNVVLPDVSRSVILPTSNQTIIPRRDETLSTLLYPICRVKCAATQANMDQMAAFGGPGACPGYTLSATTSNITALEWAQRLRANGFRGDDGDVPPVPGTRGDEDEDEDEDDRRLATRTSKMGIIDPTFPNADEFGCLATCEADDGLSPVDATGLPVLRYFVLGILQLVFMIVLNDLCMITVAWDRVKASPKPEKWRLDQLFFLSMIMAITVTALEFLFLWITTHALPVQGEYHEAACDAVSYWGGECGNIDWNVFRRWFNDDIPQLQASQQVSLMYISVSVAGMLTLLSGRARSFFWESLPGTHLLVAGFMSIIITLLLGGLIKSSSIEFQGCTPDGNWDYVGVALLYNAFGFICLDIVKVFTNTCMDQYESSCDDGQLTEQKQQLMEIRREHRINLSRSVSRRQSGQSTSSFALSSTSSSRGSQGVSETMTMTPVGLPRPRGISGGEEKDFRRSRVVMNSAPAIEVNQAQFMRARRLSHAGSQSAPPGPEVLPGTSAFTRLAATFTGLVAVTNRLAVLSNDEEAGILMERVQLLEDAI